MQLYQKSYNGGGEKDSHCRVFQQAQQYTKAQTVLYPGCHRHLTASLVFSNVVYVDYNAKVAPLYDASDEFVRDYVLQNKVYDNAEPKYRFHSCNVEQTKQLTKLLTAKKNGKNSLTTKFDLLISLSAGTIAGACTQFVNDQGYLLVNDSHSDARSIFVGGNNDWKLLAYWDDATQDFSTAQLDRCFQAVVKQRGSTTAGGSSNKKKAAPLTAAQVQESIEVGAVNKRSFKMLLEPNFFLFRRQKTY